MAKIHTEGLDELMLDMQAVAELPDEVANEMLQAGGEVNAKWQRRRYKALLYDKGTLEKSVKVSRMKTKRDGTRFVAIYPQGTHHTYTHNGTTKKVTNAEVLFVHEYGAPQRGIVAKGLMRMANEESAAETTQAQYDVYDRFLSKHKL